MQNVKYHIDLDIELDQAGLSDKEVVSMFRRAIVISLGNGTFTSGTDATVEGWSTDVSRVEQVK